MTSTVAALGLALPLITVAALASRVVCVEGNGQFQQYVGVIRIDAVANFIPGDQPGNFRKIIPRTITF